MENTVKNLEEFYKAIKARDKKAKLLFELQKCYNGLFDFDPISFENLPSNLDEVLLKFTSHRTGGDRLYRIFLYVRDACKNIIDTLHTKILREHILMPIYQARETDGKTIRWLNKKPGRNIREKLLNSNRILAVKRLQSVDTAENRLFKAFMKKLDYFLYLYETCVLEDGVYFDDITFISRWLRSDDAEFIGDWKNTPPNNTLLSDRNYKKVWIAWLELQNIDEDVKKDFENFGSIVETMTSLYILSIFYKQENIFIQQPLKSNSSFLFDFGLEKTIGFDKGKFEMSFPVKSQNEIYKKIANEFLEKLSATSQTKIESNSKNETAEVFICDISSIKPLIKKDNNEIYTLPFLLLEQFWFEKNFDKYQVLNCGNSRAIILDYKDKNYKCVKTFSIQNVLYTENNSKNDSPYIKEAASNFIHRLAEYNPCNKCIYLLPDSLDEFSSEVIRMNMNLYFHNSQNLPGSIAKIFEQLNKIQNVNTGDYFLIVEKNETETIYTPIQASVERDAKLEKLIPETGGIIWERHPPIVEPIDNKIETKSDIEKSIYSLFLNSDLNVAPYIVDSNFTFKKANDFKQNLKTNRRPNELKKYKFKKEFIIINRERKDLLNGAKIFSDYQNILNKNNVDVPLWKDHLPELKLKTLDIVITLVGKNTDAIIPKPGKSVHIPISQEFEIPNDVPFCEFELIRGDGKQKEKFYAYLSNKMFPLDKSVRCKLNLQYTYGADSPYELFFVPTDSKDRTQFGSFKTIWTKDKRPIDLSSLPIPAYGKINSWKDYKKWNDDKREDDDLIEWLGRVFENIKGVKKYGWGWHEIVGIARGGNSKYLSIPSQPDAVFYKKNCCEEKIFQDLGRGDIVYCYIINEQKNREQLVAYDVTDKSKPTSSKCFLTKRLRFPMYTVWSNGFTLNNNEADYDFKNHASEARNAAEDIINDINMPESMKDEMRLFLSVLHQDMPESNSDFLFECITDVKLLKKYWRNIAYALGNCSMQWQKDIFNKVVDRIKNKRLSHLCLRILAIAFWRSKKLVFKLSVDDLRMILKKVSNVINFNIDNIKSKSQKSLELTDMLELLLSLLRLREKEEYRKILSPESSQMQEIIGLIKKINKSKLKETRIQFEDNAELADAGLVEALEIYILGDTRAKYLKIIGVKESNE
ncbi:MAG: DUF2357 domain-containing protein [Treponemataceae bacterium]